jgi:hypothetical protein
VRDPGLYQNIAAVDLELHLHLDVYAVVLSQPKVGWSVHIRTGKRSRRERDQGVGKENGDNSKQAPPEINWLNEDCPSEMHAFASLHPPMIHELAPTASASLVSCVLLYQRNNKSKDLRGLDIMHLLLATPRELKYLQNATTLPSHPIPRNGRSMHFAVQICKTPTMHSFHLHAEPPRCPLVSYPNICAEKYV